MFSCVFGVFSYGLDKGGKCLYGHYSAIIAGVCSSANDLVTAEKKSNLINFL